MNTDSLPAAPATLHTVFLSYASEDREVAKLIRDALPGLGLEVWYDESDLDGGDAWDQKIRRQIRECDFFMPVISAQTEKRSEGYFRREWRLAVERTLDMADDHIFLLPVVIDDTKQEGARVPEKFLSVQWTRLPGGKLTPAFEALCGRLASGQAAVEVGQQKEKVKPRPLYGSGSYKRPYPLFPIREPSDGTAGYYGHVFLWLFHAGWIAFMRWPRWVRIIAYLWLAVLAMKACDSASNRPAAERARPTLSRADAESLKNISDAYRGSTDPADLAKLNETLAKSFPSVVGKIGAQGNPLLALPFSAPAGDEAAKSVADKTFAQVYGRMAVSHPGQVGLNPNGSTAGDISAAVELGRKQHAQYVLTGAIDPQSTPQSLTVMWISTEDRSVVWSGTYPVASADPERIAKDVEGKAPKTEED